MILSNLPLSKSYYFFLRFDKILIIQQTFQLVKDYHFYKVEKRLKKAKIRNCEKKLHLNVNAFSEEGIF